MRASLGSTSRRRRATAVAAVLAMLSVLGVQGTALAWKPYTHNTTGDAVTADLADGTVTVAGRSYPVDAKVTSAINSWPAYFNAGVIGPDGFPDIAYGQSTIHPGEPASTGTWLGYLLQQAWAVQGSASYSAQEQGQALAFAYGFLMHAAGDTWAHTLMNDYAEGIFPSVKEVLTKSEATRIALRHLIAEAYIGSATAGFDPVNGDATTVGPCADPVPGLDTICSPGTANEQVLEASQVCPDPDQAPNPATHCQTEGPFGIDVPDVSPNAARGIDFAVPTRWLQATMIDLSAATPADTCDHSSEPGDLDQGCPQGTYVTGAANQLTRGKILDIILDQEAKLQIYAATTQYDADHTMCSTSLDPDCYDTTTRIDVPTVRGHAYIDVPDTRCDGQFVCVADVLDEADDLVDSAMASYAQAWADDIDAMRAHWSDFSLAVTKGLFDPQTRRDAANDACGTTGPESVSNNVRMQCEAGVGSVSAVVYALDHAYDAGEPSWINRYLIPAAGLPDAVGVTAGFLTKVGDAIGDVFTFIGVANPIALISADVNAFVDDQVNGWLEDQYGINPAAIDDFQSHMNQWMCGTDVNNPASITIPGAGTFTPGGLFTDEEHDRLDGLMGLPADHHQVEGGLPEDCGPLAQGATLNPATFAPLRNTVTLGKLLTLDGPTLNRALGDALADAGVVRSPLTVQTYGAKAAGFPANVMVDGLGADGRATHITDLGVLSGEAPWLHLIDADHAWRADGLPRFCGATPTPDCQPRSTTLTGQITGGNGNFPIWESCLLRPAFRSLFTDWEDKSGDNFPDLYDTVSPDASDPSAPTTHLLPSNYTTVGGTTYLRADSRLSLSAEDDVFADGQLRMRYRVFPAAGAPEDAQWTSVAGGGVQSIAITGPDGPYRVQYQAEDPCHTFDPGDALADPPFELRDFTLDTTGPQLTVTSPAPEAVVLTSSAKPALAFTAVDAGSGVASSGARLDGANIANGTVIDASALAPGIHSVAVNAIDNLGNTSAATRTFRVRATSASLLQNLTAARATGQVPDAATYQGLRDKLTAAARSHTKGDHVTEWAQLQAFINQLAAQRGKGVAAATADRLTAFAKDLIASKG